MGHPLQSGDADTGADANGDAGEVGTVRAPAAKSKWPARIGLASGALIAVGAVVATAIAVSAPRPDATLTQTGEGASPDALTLIAREVAYFKIRGSTLHAHDLFEGWAVFSGSNAYGSPCLVAIAPAEDWIRAECTPAPAELVADSHPYTQPNGPMIRFILDGDVVHAWVHPHAKAQ